MSTQVTQRTEACGKCAYWNPVSGDSGECRRHPPQAISFKVNEETKFETRFPTTATTDWCGEFEAK